MLAWKYLIFTCNCSHLRVSFQRAGCVADLIARHRLSDLCSKKGILTHGLSSKSESDRKSVVLERIFPGVDWKVVGGFTTCIRPRLRLQ